VCHFRTEYDVFPDLADTTFYIEAELMFADLSKLTQPKVDSNIGVINLPRLEWQ